jgi:DNA-binding response OmpR family regulator
VGHFKISKSNLTAKEFQILSRLVRELGRPIPQTAIWAAAWDANTEFDDRAAKLLRVYMSTLRRKLKRFGLYILAKPSVGYVLSTSECVCLSHKDGQTQ